MIFQVSLRVSLGSVDQGRVFGGIPDEEDGSVEKNPIQVALFGPQFESETVGVTSGISGTRLASDGGETDGGRNLLSDFVEKGLGCDGAQVVGDFEFTICTGTLRMDLRSSMDVSSQSVNESK